MAKEPIVSTLFRFVTTRNPQLLSEDEQERGFIYYPKNERQSSHFLVDLDEEEDRDALRTLLEGRLATYAPYARRSSVKSVLPELYTFSHWLMKNKNTITTDEIATRALGVATLTTTQLKQMWANLHYQVIGKKSKAVREAVIRMIVADNFLKKNDFTSGGGLITNDKELRRLANAYVVIDNKIVNNFPWSITQSREANSKDLELLEQELTAFEADKDISDIQTALDEVNNLIESRNLENTKNFEAAYKTYETDLSSAYKKASPSKDPDTDLEVFDDLSLPKLNFEQKTIFDDNYLDDNLSVKSLNVLKPFKDPNLTEELLLKKLSKELSQRFEKSSALNTKAKGSAYYKGNIITKNERALPLYSYTAGVKRELGDPDNAVVSLNLFSGYENTKIKASSLDITFSDDSRIEGVSGTYQAADGKTIILSTFPNTIAIPKETTYLKAKGTITLDNEELVEIDTVQIPLDGTKAGGTATSQRLSQERPKVEHHGIKKVGIADFTKVEQEVCCYVPGEVSRIENILAREYKERSTRQLISTETTTEETTEKEIENLTDTTTSERNELSSEISSIVNEDKSKAYGASAGVSGKAYGVEFFANGYFDGASSSSSSNSNSTSQTYAEEVTTRALERVVQKVTKKRTSRILREFEDNNKHGFDNRGGDTHVTGIYRWVDKIYTNRLVNYGKRLMYEFNVPEPSRFFKEAIIQQLDQEQQQGVSPEGLIVPTQPNRPNYHGIYNSNSITEANYKGFAAIYGAEVNPPKDQYVRVGEAFVKNDKSYDTNAYNFGKLDIPEGYRAIDGSVTTLWFRKGGNASWTLSVALGDKRQVANSSGQNLSFSYNFSDGYIDEIPFSISCSNVHSGHFSVTARCQRTVESYKQWQEETYNAIIAAYKAKVNEYNDYLNSSFIPAPLDPGEKSLEFNPLINRDLEKRELKRLAIEMLARPFGISTAKDNYLNGSDTHISLTAAFDRHSDYVKFFEQAFEWEIMAYLFYPYFYSNEGSWEELFQQTNSSDPLFQAFLQSAMARMVVPVRPGFEKAVNYFLETGEIMVGDQLAVERDDDLYLSIAEEMETTDGTVEKEWETRVPTALTIVQANAAPLNETGLPCCHNEDETDNLAHGNSVMVGKDDAPQV